MICDDCTPNQTWMKVKQAVGLVFVVLVFLFIAAVAFRFLEMNPVLPALSGVLLHGV